MLLGARTQMLDGKYTFEEMFQFGKECGVEAFEYCCEDVMFQYRPETTEDHTIEHVRELSETYGIRIGAVGNHLAFVKDLHFEAIKKMIPKVRRLGTDIFIISSNPPSGDFNFKIRNPELYVLYKERVKELTRVAEDCGVKLALEPEPPGFVPSTRDMLELMEEVGSEALCVNFDIGHAFLTDEDMYESIRILGNRIVHAHIENLIRGEHLHRLLEDGDIDLKKCLQAMAQAGFDGAVAIDLYAYDYDKVLKSQISQLRQLMGR